MLKAGAALALVGPATARALPFPAPMREAMLPVPGGRVYVRVNGDLGGPRPPLVIVNGGPGSVHGSYLEALALADERAVILYDQLDAGRSDWPQDPTNWRVARFVDELAAVASGLGVTRWHVCGHSWGGTVALEYGARRPAALAGLVLASPLVSTASWLRDADTLRTQLSPPVQATLRACETAAPPPAQTCDAATADFYAHFLTRQPRDAATMTYNRDHGGRGFGQRMYETMWGRTEFVSTGTLKDYDGTPLLARLDGARTLFMVGQYDEARPATVAAFAARVPGAEFAVVPGSGHATLSDRPYETLAILRGFLRRHDSRV
jgi:proline iminopeptidase/L-proline amide hydrolase